MMLSSNVAVRLSPLFSIRSDIATAKQDLDLLRAFLRFTDSHQDSETNASTWVNQVRDAAFELEDVADECCYLSGNGRGWVNVKAWFALSRRLRKARERLHQLSAAKELYNVQIHPANGSALPVAVLSSRIVANNAHFITKQEIVGFDGHEKKLLEWVAKDADPHGTMMLVAVCGMGGVGKTTLVTRVYKEVATSYFESAAWVAVSQGFTMDGLLRKIIKELHRDSCSPVANGRSDATDADYRSLVQAVRDCLHKKRYLVVLDDVWDAHLWGKLRHAFPDDNTGSRVIITTRIREVAKAAAPERTMMLEPLPWLEAWRLFCNVAFREVPGKACPSHLKNLAEIMLKRCRGLPLAIASVGNLLALKERTEFAWTNVRDSLLWDKSSDDLGIGEAASILNLSIDDLPHHTKKCFLSCSMYPEDFLMKRKILIRKWIAEGFVQEKPGQCTLGDVADEYLDQLVQRNLMQPTVRNEFGRAKRCRIHDLIRELIVHRSREEEMSFQFAECKVVIDFDGRIRHLAVDRCEMDCHSVPKQSSIRSFHASLSELDSSFLSRFKLLTVLNLWFIEIKRLPDSITNLYNLRYLGVRSTLVEELPKDIGKLQKLLTLDTKFSRVQTLPSSIMKIKSLRHLILFRREAPDLLKMLPGMAVEVPKGLESLTCLQTLKYVQADKTMVSSLARLQQMRSMDISGLNASLMADLSLSISRMSCLRRLGLEMEPAAHVVLDLESITRPPVNLKVLAITGRLARGKLPSWACSLMSLTQLTLCNCGISSQASLLILEKLPRLMNLGVIAAFEGTTLTFARGSFPTLERLTLQDLPNLSHIEFQEGCLVNLHALVLIRCRKLSETPQGMHNLKRLKNLNLFGFPKQCV